MREAEKFWFRRTVLVLVFRPLSRWQVDLQIKKDNFQKSLQCIPYTQVRFAIKECLTSGNSTFGIKQIVKNVSLGTDFKA